MASTRQDALAKRLADRLQNAPAKGRVAKTQNAAPSRPARRARPEPETEAESARPARSRSTKSANRRPTPSKRPATTPAPTTRIRRGATGTALRGHLVPDALHGQARRRKTEVSARRGARVTWDDVMQEGITLLVDDPEIVPDMLDEMFRTTDHGRGRLVQATLPIELDQRLVEVQLDVSEAGTRAATYEQLWAIAMMLWLRSPA